MKWITLFKTLPEAELALKGGRLFTVLVQPLPFKICVVYYMHQYFAFADNCPHKRAAFSRGGYLTQAGGVVCPLHHYVFDLKTGDEITNNGCQSMDIFPVRADADGLAVRLPIFR